MRALLLTLLGVLLAAPAFADWKDEVADQLLNAEHCFALFYTDVLEQQSDGQETVFARAHCEDQRAFDVSRRGSDGPFVIRPCGQAAC